MKYLLTLVACSLSAMLSAQQFVVGADKMNKVYVGMPSRLTVVSGNCGCDALSVTAAKGTITKIEGCTYSYTPDQPGNAELLIFENRGGRATLIAKNILRVRSISSLKAAVGGKSGGNIPLNQFKIQMGLTVIIDGYEYQVPAKVTNFTFKVFRNGVVITQIPVMGYLFNNDCLKAISSLKHGDKVVFEDIRVVGGNICPKKLNDIAFTMK